MNYMMRSHIQGLGLVAGVAVAVVLLALIARPTLDDAFGENGAVRAEEAVDIVELSAEGEVLDPVLSADEVTTLQFLIGIEGIETGGLDGVMGPGTRGAMDEIIIVLELDPEISDRALYNVLVERVAAAKAAEDAAAADAEGAEAAETVDAAG